MSSLVIHPLASDRRDDLVDLIGPERGASFGCRCMWGRMPRAGHRGEGMMRVLLDGAVELAAAGGAELVEACPMGPARKLSWGEGYHGVASVFRAAGFKVAARRSPTRPLMQLQLPGRRATGKGH